MEEHSDSGQGQIAVRVEPSSFSVAPGGSLSIPLSLHNQASAEGSFELSVRGVPTPWVFIPSQVVRLAPDERREVPLTIQVPTFPPGRPGRHRLVIRVANQAAPGEAAEVQCTLTVAALEVPGRIGMLLPATEFSVVPGEKVTIPIVLLNQGLEGDVFSLTVDGIPATWAYSPSASTPLSPGQETEVPLTVQPPRSLQTGAGRHPFKIQARSQAAPGQVAQADCILTIATFAEFSGELRPQQVEAGQPARVLVENRGNIQQAFTVTHHSPDDTLLFEPGPTQELRVPPGEVAIAEFRARPRSRPLFGREVTYPFTSQLQAAGAETQNLRGEVVGRALIPSWVLPAALGLILVVACISILIAVLGGAGREARPTQPPDVQATPTMEGPAPTDVAPTEPPPEQPPTEPPPEQPPTGPPPEQPPTEPPPEQPPEQPPEEPPEEPPPTAEQLPEGPAGGGLPCTPAALGLLLAPLLMLHRNGQR